MSALIIGCGSVGRLVEKLENNPLCICKSESSANLLISQGVDATALNLEAIQTSDKLFNKKYIYYFIPPPSKGNKDTTITHFINHIDTNNVRKIVLISTTGIYGDCKGDWIDETQRVNPQADRAKRRVDAEKQLISFCNKNKINYTIIRVPGIYGPGKLPITRLKNKKPILNISESPYSNRIHIEDLSNIIFRVMHTNLTSTVYNVADNVPLTMSEYFIKAAQALRLEEPPQISLSEAKKQLSSNMLSYLTESKRINNKALLNELNYKLKFPNLDIGLKNCITSVSN